MRLKLLLVQVPARSVIFILLISYVFDHSAFSRQVSINPFLSFPSAECDSAVLMLNDWQLVGTFLTEDIALALVKHPQQGIKKVKVGDRFMSHYWKIDVIASHRIEFVTVPPCQATRVTLSSLAQGGR